MKSFLQQVVVDVLGKYDLPDVVFVLPNKRAIIFLKNTLKEHFSDQSSWLPPMYTIDQLMEKLSDYRIADDTRLLFMMYQAYKQVYTSPESFDNFLKWGRTLLQDFNDMDSYLVDPREFFDHLISVERMEKWSPEEEQQTELIKKNFLFWKTAHNTYRSLLRLEDEQKMAHRGMVYRKAVGGLVHVEVEIKTGNYVFVGFNALSLSEEKVMQYLLDHNKAATYWDSDVYYLNNKHQEAGKFLRKHKGNLIKGKSVLIVEEALSKPKEIQIVGVSGLTMQAKFAGNKLEEYLLNENQTTLDIAWILADQNLLEPALHALPKTLGKINVTMGYALKNIALGQFFVHYIKLLVNKVRYQGRGFYHVDLIDFLSHRYTRYLIPESQQIIEELTRQNQPFLSSNSNWLLVYKDFHRWLEMDLTPKEVIHRAIEMVTFLKEQPSIVADFLEKEYLFRFHALWHTLAHLVDQYDFLDELKTLQQIYLQEMQQSTINFEGEPLQGIQLMGILETRLLDFKHIVITSMNEGIFPKGKTDNSFIPYDIRCNYQLPTYQEQDAVVAYHFYRLLQRAQKICLVYNTEVDVYGGGEKSRFLKQLEIEWPHEIQLSIASEITKHAQIDKLTTIEKTPSLLEALHRMVIRGFSPTSLAAYVIDPMLFYQRYVLRIDEVDSIEETMDSRVLGSVMHKILEQLYKPYLNTVLTLENVQDMKRNLPESLDEAFKEISKHENYKQGKNFLAYSAAKRYLENFLNYEQSQIKKGNQITILALEKKVEGTLQLDQHHAPIQLKGTIDRIDRYNGQIRIIDYKTGKVSVSDLKINLFEDLISDQKYTKALQLMVYAYLYQQLNPTLSFSAGIICFRHMRDGFMPLKLEEEHLLNHEVIEAFVPCLQCLITEILNPEIDIVEKSD